MLWDALQSVWRQSCNDFEVIVVDDGSTDETAGRLRRMGGAVRVISQSRRGVAAARNRGARAARGRYLAFLDSDDLWLPNKLAAQLAFMDAAPEIAICQTEEIWIRRGSRVNPKAKHRKPNGDIFQRSLDLCLVSPSAVMMTADLLVRSGGFDETLPVCEDYDLWLRIAIHHPVPLLPQALVIKRGGHADQLSHSIWGMDRFRVLALQKLLRSGIAGERRRWALAALKRKVAVLATGARKRDQESAALAYEAMGNECEQLDQELADDAGASPGVCQGARISSPDSRANVGVDRARLCGARPADPGV
jgi:glycosyltransferase involved in cell wall biosynthesis